MDLVSIVNVALLSLLNMNNFPYDYNDATIYTPVGTAIGVYDITEELPIYYIYDLIDDTEDDYPGNVLMGLPSIKYNCHSYAWYKQKPNERNYWLEYESPFYTDGSYIEVSYKNVQPGDRVCYFDSLNMNVHSAIVTRKLSAFSTGGTVLNYADLIEIDSKWGEAGLYSGRGDTTPYTPNNGGSASYLRFYHYNYSHTHSYTYTQISGDEEYHTAECSCVFFYQKHSYSFVYVNVYSSIGGDEQQYLVPAYKCTKCNYISYIEEYNYV